ncbi:MAG TPA: PAS-domain containing protein [Parvularculaceae bacterium]|nr:PAS-domain containing protein [Caulobacterales bacterium]HPE30789.1 PAS-domain containing protein [Parvularculaceae bacterium]
MRRMIANLPALRRPRLKALKSKALLTGTSVLACIAMTAPPAAAADGGFLSSIDPLLVGAIGAVSIALAAVAWALRVSAATRSQSVSWSDRLAEIETQLEKADAVLSAHPGLVLVWEDDYETVEKGWGQPKILGGPAALASLMSFARQGERDVAASPVDRLLETLGDLPVEDDGPPEDIKKLREKVRELRAHGIPFSGSIVTTEGRAIEADGRVAGGQVALWLTDPAARMAEDSGLVGKVRERTADLHGALAMLDRAPMPAWRRDTALALTWVNKAYVDAVEAQNAAAVLKDQTELDPAARKIAEKAASERKPVDGRIIVNIRGERRVLKVTETPMHHAGDASLGGFAIDTTELDKTRNELRQHIEANRRTLDEIPAAVAMFNATQNLAYFNRAFARLWSLDEADLDGQPSHGELLDRLRQAGKLPEPSDYNEWKNEQLALYAADVSPAGEERRTDAPDAIWHLPDGRTLRVARARHPLGGVLVVFDDITERLSLEARYNTQINVQHATLNNLSEGVAVFGADGGLRLHNIAFQKLWRLDADLLSGRPHIDSILGALKGGVLRGDDALADIKRRATSLSPEDRTPIKERSFQLIDGRTIQYGTEPLPDGATLLHFVDVTDTREREKELKERNAFLEDIDRQKSKFVDHVSYQLRTPLATIIGFSEMLDNQMFGMLNDRQKDYIASILSASHHLRDLINDIIDLAVIDAGKMTIDPSEIEIRDLLKNAATYAALKAEDTQVSLAVECPKDIGKITADAKRLKQVLFNLLSNAFAYTGAGGKVTLGADRAPGLVRIWVADTGRGVSPEDQAKAFDPFESRGPSAGAGIGLSLVQRFVSLHGGWVRMESELGRGTRVTCYLPAVQKAPAAEPPETEGADQASSAPPAEKKPPEAAPAKPRRRAAPKGDARPRAAE